MSKITMGLICVLLVLALLPFALVARSRASTSPKSAPHLILDMDKQPKYKAQRPSEVFADGRSMRPQVAGTVALEDMAVPSEILNDPKNPHLVNGEAGMVLGDPVVSAAVLMGRVRTANMSDADFEKLVPPGSNGEANAAELVANDTTFYVRTVPSPLHVTTEFVKRGQERFNIYCAPCHGYSGYGDGMVAQRAEALRNGPDPSAASAWVQPQDLNDPKIAARPDGHIFNTITNGIRSMPPYDKQISVADRWAIVTYVRALERSQRAQPGDLTAEESQKFAR
jgi:mono/diheme cytochrome c family protein